MWGATGDSRARGIGRHRWVTRQVDMPRQEARVYQLPLQRSQSWIIPEQPLISPHVAKRKESQAGERIDDKTK